MHAPPTLVDSIIDQNVRLQRSHVGVEIQSVLVCPGILPFAVEPEDAQWSVAFDQLAQLSLQIGHVAIHIRLGLGRLASRAAQRIIRMTPVADRMIGAEDDPLLPARIGQFPQHIAAKRCRHDVIIGEL